MRELLDIAQCPLRPNVFPKRTGRFRPPSGNAGDAVSPSANQGRGELIWATLITMMPAASLPVGALRQDVFRMGLQNASPGLTTPR